MSIAPDEDVILVEGKGSSSFLKKRTKKLLPVGLALLGEASAKTDESCLLLFFKEEDLAAAR
jgi:hypothetical protein